MTKFNFVHNFIADYNLANQKSFFLMSSPWLITETIITFVVINKIVMKYENSTTFKKQTFKWIELWLINLHLNVNIE